MDDQIVAELSALRERAYGPGAGLGEDSVALRRLEDLEELSRARAAPLPERDDAPGPAAAVAGEPPAVVEGEPDATAAEVPSENEAPGPRLWWTRRRIAFFWMASLVVAVLLSSTISAAFTYRLQADPREIAVIRADPGAEWPKFFGDQEGQVFAEFYGLRAFAQESLFPEAGPTACLQVAEKSILDADLQQGFQGAYYPGGCGAGAFGPTAAVVVADNAPAELRERFPDGTSLQFVLRGSEVVVLEAPPAPTPEPSIDAAR